MEVPMLSLEQQSNQMESIKEYVYLFAPMLWNHVSLQYLAMGDYMEGRFSAILADGSSTLWTPNLALSYMVVYLHEGMRSSNAGTWFSAQFSFNYRGYANTSFNFDDEPNFRAPQPAAEYQYELERFDWAPDRIPVWLKEKAQQ